MIAVDVIHRSILLTLFLELSAGNGLRSVLLDRIFVSFTCSRVQQRSFFRQISSTNVISSSSRKVCSLYLDEFAMVTGSGSVKQ